MEENPYLKKLYWSSNRFHCVQGTHSTTPKNRASNQIRSNKDVSTQSS